MIYAEKLKRVHELTSSAVALGGTVKRKMEPLSNNKDPQIVLKVIIVTSAYLLYLPAGLFLCFPSVTSLFSSFVISKSP